MVTANAPSRTPDAPGCQVPWARTERSSAYAMAIGGSARRGPYRSISAARAGERKTLVAPNRAMTAPAREYEPVASLTASIREREIIPYDSRPSSAAPKVREA